jgi:hypothetical protein
MYIKTSPLSLGESTKHWICFSGIRTGRPWFAQRARELLVLPPCGNTQVCVMLLRCSYSWQMGHTRIEHPLLSRTSLLPCFSALSFPDSSPRSQAFNGRVLPKLQKGETLKVGPGTEPWLGSIFHAVLFSKYWSTVRRWKEICVSKHPSFLVSDQRYNSSPVNPSSESFVRALLTHW